MALDHISIGVSDMKRAKAFYDATLAHVGLAPVFPVEANNMLVACGYGEEPNKAVFWIGMPINMQAPSAGNGVHIAFSAETRAAVDAFYLAALENGGVEDGRPGLRTEYHPDYYAAFVRDRDGNKIEAVCHTKE